MSTCGVTGKEELTHTNYLGGGGKNKENHMRNMENLGGRGNIDNLKVTRSIDLIACTFGMGDD